MFENILLNLYSHLLSIIPILSFQFPCNRVGKVWNCLKYKSEQVKALERRIPLFCVSISYVYTNKKKNLGLGCGLSTTFSSLTDETALTALTSWQRAPMQGFGLYQLTPSFKLGLRDSRYQQQSQMLPVSLGSQEVYAEIWAVPCQQTLRLRGGPWLFYSVLLT